MTNDNKLPQLMTAFDHYRDVVMVDEPDDVRQAALLHFMAGATTVVELVRDAAKQGGQAGAAFNTLANETDAFTQAVTVYGALFEKRRGKEKPH